MPRSGGQVPWPAAMLLPLRKPPHWQGHSTSLTLLTPLFSVGLPSLSGHRKQPAAQAGSRLVFLLKEAAASGVPTQPQGTGQCPLRPLGKGLCGKARLFIPRVKNYLREDKMQEHDFELFIPDL